MNPFVAKIYKKHETSPSMKKWKSQKSYLSMMYLLGILVPSLIAAFFFYYLAPISVLSFGLLLVGIRMLPRFFDMYMQTSYPNVLLLIELVNGTILSFGGAWLLGWL